MNDDARRLALQATYEKLVARLLKRASEWEELAEKLGRHISKDAPTNTYMRGVIDTLLDTARIVREILGHESPLDP